MYKLHRNTKYHNTSETIKIIHDSPRDRQNTYSTWFAQDFSSLGKTHFDQFSYFILKPCSEFESGKYINKSNIAINKEKAISSFLISDKIIPIELNSLKEEIIRSQFILSLDNDEQWNEDNNKQIPHEMYNLAIDFLISQCVYIFRQFGIVINSPEINPCPNGTIDLSWRSEKARLLINIKPSPKGYLAYYYGDYYNNESPIKGYVFLNKVSAFLAVWMRDLN